MDMTSGDKPNGSHTYMTANHVSQWVDDMLFFFPSADMINMFRLKFVPSCCVWLYAGEAATPAVAW